MSDPIEIHNWRRLDDRITTSGQPTQAQLGALRPLGIEHVINLGLHTHEKALPDEAGSLACLGIDYVHIPVAFDRPTQEDFSRFCDALAAIGDKPIHIHCIANMRVTAFLYRYQREVLDQDGEDARKLMDTVWQPGGVWAAFIGDDASQGLPHRGNKCLSFLYPRSSLAIENPIVAKMALCRRARQGVCPACCTGEPGPSQTGAGLRPARVHMIAIYWYRKDIIRYRIAIRYCKPILRQSRFVQTEPYRPAYPHFNTIQPRQRLFCAPPKPLAPVGEHSRRVAVRSDLYIFIIITGWVTA